MVSVKKGEKIKFKRKKVAGNLLAPTIIAKFKLLIIA